MKISIITLFPEMFEGPFRESIIKRAIDKRLLKIKFVDLRNFGIGKHKIVDDRPYGGGVGMILRVDVLKKAIDGVRIEGLKKSEERVILMDPAGKTFSQVHAKRLARLKHLIIVCGHYEGVDDRIREYIDEEVSVGDFVLTGGEIPAMAVVDAVGRNVAGVLKKGVTESESFSGKYNLCLEAEQFTRPEKFEGYSVPKILLSGNHEQIKKWKEEKARAKTKKLRPDLL